jgi:hypothetical protein
MINTPNNIKIPNNSCVAVKGSLRIKNANIAPKRDEKWEYGTCSE